MGNNQVEVTEVVTGVEAAVRAMGSQAALASKLKIKQQAVSLWVKRGYVPERHVDQIALMTRVPTSALMRPATVRRARDGSV
jgi:hypothetical protein